MISLGIDVGLQGALASWDNRKKELRVVDMPIRQKIKSGKKKNEVDGYKLTLIIEQLLQANSIYRVNLELVGSRPGEGATSSFTFGEGKGMIRGVLEAMNLKYDQVTPQVWKKAWKIPPGGDKKTTLAIARKLCPGNPLFKLEKHSGRSDAFLIALYNPEKKSIDHYE